jgi:hypothetical protein
MDLVTLLKDEPGIISLFEKAEKNGKYGRTDTEIRIGVLDNSKYPNPAFKYYKSLKEIGNLEFELNTLLFEYREKELEESEDDVKKDKRDFQLKTIYKAILGKIKELKIWETIILDLEPILIQHKLPLDNEDAIQKIYLLIGNLKKYVSLLEEDKIEESKMSYNSLVSNAQIIEKENLLEPVISELTLKEKHILKSQNILPIDLTSEEEKLISEAASLNTNNTTELKELKTKLDKLLNKET